MSWKDKMKFMLRQKKDTQDSSKKCYNINT